MAKRGKNAAFEVLSTKQIFKHLPFILFVSLVLGFYIANVHYCENKMREIQHLKSELQELKYHYNSLNAELMRQSKQSVIEKDLAVGGVKLSGDFPRILKYEE